MENKYFRPGFTLIEIIIVIAIIGLLATATALALNVPKIRADARNNQRQSDISLIMNAVYQYSLDNDGQVPAAITSLTTAICRTGAGSCAGLVDLSALTASQKYLVNLPVDPQGAVATNSTGYTIAKNAAGRVTVAAPVAENGATISLTR